MNDYLVELNPSYASDSDVSSLPEDDIVSDSDEFVDAIQSHYLRRKAGADFELESFSSSSSDEFESAIESDVDEEEASSDYSDEEDRDGTDGEKDYIQKRRRSSLSNLPLPPERVPSTLTRSLSARGSSRLFKFSRRKPSNLSNLTTKLPFRKQPFRNSQSLDVDFPLQSDRSANQIIQKNSEEINTNKVQQSNEDIECRSTSTMSSRSYSVSTMSTSLFLPPPIPGKPEGYFPTSFNAKHPNPLSTYFDQQLMNHGISPTIKFNFYSEHVIFLRAVLQLFDEREKVGVEAAADDPNTIKTGPLKKKMSLRKGKGGFGRFGWKMKYVEIRKGMLSYYENSKDMEGELLRRNLPLRANVCSCRPVPKLDQVSHGFFFELMNESGTSTTWMSNSKEERASWIRAINKGMIGKSTKDKLVTDGSEIDAMSSTTSFHEMISRRSPLDIVSGRWSQPSLHLDQEDYVRYLAV